MASRPLCEIEASRRFDRLFRNPLLDSNSMVSRSLNSISEAQTLKKGIHLQGLLQICAFHVALDEVK